MLIEDGDVAEALGVKSLMNDHLSRWAARKPLVSSHLRFGETDQPGMSAARPCHHLGQYQTGSV